jgi:hypothetical protein
MTPIDLAISMGKSPELEDRATGVAIIVRALTDDDGVRSGWPLTDAVVVRAAQHIGVEPTADLVAAATRIAPTLSDAILNIRR